MKNVGILFALAGIFLGAATVTAGMAVQSPAASPVPAAAARHAL